MYKIKVDEKEIQDLILALACKADKYDQASARTTDRELRRYWTERANRMDALREKIKRVWYGESEIA